MAAIQTHVLILVSETAKDKLSYLKVVLRCAVSISKGRDDVSETIIHTLIGLLAIAEGKSLW